MAKPNANTTLKRELTRRRVIEDWKSDRNGINNGAVQLREELTIRAALELGIASFGNPRLGEWLERNSEFFDLWVSPQEDGSVHLMSNPLELGHITVEITPENLDVGPPGERSRRLYRSFFDLIRQTPVSEKDEGSRKVGPFKVLCNPNEDAENWERVWKRWK